MSPVALLLPEKQAPVRITGGFVLDAAEWLAELVDDEPKGLPAWAQLELRRRRARARVAELEQLLLVLHLEARDPRTDEECRFHRAERDQVRAQLRLARLAATQLGAVDGDRAVPPRHEEGR